MWCGHRDVVPFSGFGRDMRFPAISEVRAYWEALRCDAGVPLRSQVDPRGIEGALDQAFILERIAPGVARFRVAGGHLSDIMGMEVRGMPILSFFAPEARAEAAPLLEAVFTRPAAAEFTLRAQPAAGCPVLLATLLVLPLRSDLGDVSRALGCLATQGAIGRSPRRFDITGRRVTPIETPPLPAGAPGPAPRASGFAEAPAPFAPPVQGAGRRGHLRLVKSD